MCIYEMDRYLYMPPTAISRYIYAHTHTCCVIYMYVIDFERHIVYLSAHLFGFSPFVYDVNDFVYVNTHNFLSPVSVLSVGIFVRVFLLLGGLEDDCSSLYVVFLFEMVSRKCI